MEAIQYIGIEQLTPEERATLDKLSAEYYGTIQRSLKNLTSVIVHIKEYKKEGKRKKYAISVRAVAPTVIFEEKHAADWDFARTLHKAFKNIERQIQHKLHTDDQHNKPHG